MKNRIKEDLKELQNIVSRKSLKIFAETYFKHYLKCCFAPFHFELLKYLEEVTVKRNGHIAIAAPRGSAKSTIVTTIYVLWAICNELEECITIFSATNDLAEKLLSHIKDELSSNEGLRRDYPNVCEPPNPRWRADEIITKNNVNVISVSASSKIRGFRFRQNRPSLVIFDDIEGTPGVSTQEGREKTYDWFTKIALNLGEQETNFIAVGTILHFDSLLAKLTSDEEFPGWEKKIYKSVISFSDRQDLWTKWALIYRGKEFHDGKTGPEAAKRFFEDNQHEMLNGATVLWPERESYYDLMVMREQKGEFSFESEKQNEPRDLSGYSVDMNKTDWFDDRLSTIEDLKNFLGNRMVVLGSVDPAIRQSRKSDFSAIVTVFFDYANKDFYVVDADTGRWDVNTLVQRICLHHKTWKYTTFIYEANAAQAWLGDMIKKEPVAIPIKPLTNIMPKEARILKLLVLIEQRKVKLSRRLTELVRELTHYPNAAHDDAIDALSMLIDIGENFSRVDVKKMTKMIKALNSPMPSDNPNEFFIQGGQFIPNPFGLLKAK